MKSMPAFLLLGLCAVLSACSSDGGLVRSSRPVISGTVNYQARVALPPTAVLTMRLMDITNAESPVVLTERSFSNPGNPPMNFELPYPFGGITAQRRYVIEARIEVEGRLRFYSMEAHAVTPQNAAEPHEIWVEITNES